MSRDLFKAILKGEPWEVPITQWPAHAIIGDSVVANGKYRYITTYTTFNSPDEIEAFIKGDPTNVK